MPKTSTLIISSTNIKVTRDLIVNNLPEIIAMIDILNVSGTFNQKPLTCTPEEWTYPYQTMTMLQLTLRGNRNVHFELQEISNQPTWNLGTQAALQTAIIAIQAFVL